MEPVNAVIHSNIKRSDINPLNRNLPIIINILNTLRKVFPGYTLLGTANRDLMVCERKVHEV